LKFAGNFIDIVRAMPFFAALLLATVTAAVNPPRITRPTIGQPPPSFALRDQNGRRVSLAEAAGKKVVLVFYRGYW
jgi:cytochrome oxidase Cu insertion factor (SCO1/SenC/PrrC family)